MSLHIIKCKTILKINEIETINLTQYLNFHRDTETAGKSMCVWGLFRGPYFYSAFIAVLFRGIQSGSKWRSSGHILSCELGIWLAHSQNRLPGELSSTSPSKDQIWSHQSSLKSVRCSVSTLRSAGSEASPGIAAVSPIAHLHQGGLTAAWLHLFKRFNTILSRLVGPKLEWYFFFSL